jgi:hypothetical protein
MSANPSEKYAQYVLAVSIACLIAIWPLPKTMALRNLLYATGLLCAAYLCQRENWRTLKAGFQKHLPILLFFLWLLIHYVVFSVDKAAQHRELTGFWLRCLMASLLGMVLGTHIIKSNSIEPESTFSKNCLHLLFASLFGTLIIYFVRYIYEIVVTGKLLHTDFYMTPFNGKPQVAIFITILLTAIFAIFPTKLTSKRNQLLAAVSIFTILCCLFVLYTANTKNGFLIFALLVCAFVVNNLRGRMNYGKAALFVLTCSALMAVGYRHVQSNPAWNMIVPDIKTGLDIESNSYWKNWLNEAIPTNELGVAVNQSTYLRTAWFRAAAELIAENPQGYGLMSYSFSYLAKKKWPDFYTQGNNHMVATHSGWTDLTLAFGVPALLLIQFSWWRSFFRAGQFSGYGYRYIRWTVPTIAFAYLTVEVSYDVFFELLFLFLGLFSALTQPKNNNLIAVQ